jgi:hypothetical protein
MGIRSVLDRLLGRSAPEAGSPPPDRGEAEEIEEVDEDLVEKRIDDIREEQSYWTGI